MRWEVKANRRWEEKVRNAVKILDVARQYVSLEKRGQNFWGNCPFCHDEKTTFSINNEAGLFYCFKCHAGGNVFRFVSDVEGIGYFEAITKLAKEYGLGIPPFSLGGLQPSKRLFIAINRIIKELPAGRKQTDDEIFDTLADYVNKGHFDEDKKIYARQRDIFDDILSDLDNTEIRELVSVMTLGRGDDDTFYNAYKWNRRYEDDRDAAVDYMLSKSPLKIYLKRGLRKIYKKRVERNVKK